MNYECKALNRNQRQIKIKNFFKIINILNLDLKELNPKIWNKLYKQTN